MSQSTKLLYACKQAGKGKTMTIFEYGGLDKYISKDETGNVYITVNRHDADFDIKASTVMDSIKDLQWIDENTYFLAKEDYEKYCSYSIEITDDEDIYAVTCTRRPYYRMRGKNVTREQAFDIIKRTDNFFGWELEDISHCEDFVGSLNFDNWLINKNHYPEGYGWIHVDGTVGCNAITQKYPEIEEFVVEWLDNLMAFPYLDLVIAVTDANEGYIWPSEENTSDNGQQEENSYPFKSIDELEEAEREKTFKEYVSLGIEIHDKQIKILNAKEAVSKYDEYNKKYGIKPERYMPEYYQDNKITQVDEAYLRKCIEAYGLNADEELGKVSEYIWKGDRA